MSTKQKPSSPDTNAKSRYRDVQRRKSYNDLKPIKNGRKKLGDYIVFDIESNNWKDFLVAGIYDGEVFTTYESLPALCKGIASYKGYKVFAHFGGIFDFLFILDHLGLSRIIEGDLILRGSSVFSFTTGNNRFYDSSGILPFSLEKAARAFGVSHQKLEIDHSKRKVINAELIKYLEHDCRALFDSIGAFYSQPLLGGVNFKPTLASQSLEVLRTYLKEPIPSINSKSVDAFVRKGYAGGRVEIFRPHYSDVERPLYYYDFNSLYPSVMREMDVPGSVRRITRDISEMGFTDCVVECPDGLYLPLLWRKAKGKFYFPSGTIRGVFPGPEIIQAIALGYRVKKIYKTIEFENLGKVFHDYINDLYYLKQHATDETAKTVAKLLLNAGYGRIGIRRDRESLCFDDGTTGITPLDVYIGEHRLAKKESYYRGFSNPAIAAFVTCHARLKLHRAMLPLGDKVYYCDTDSIVTTERLPTGLGLGELKLEGEALQACFLLPKTYIFGNQVKMKGFPKEFAQSLNFQDFKIALEGDLKMMKTAMPGKLAKIKSARKNNGSILKLLPESAREIRALYDKRIIYRENNTFNSRPIELKNP